RWCWRCICTTCRRTKDRSAKMIVDWRLLIVDCQSRTRAGASIALRCAPRPRLFQSTINNQQSAILFAFLILAFITCTAFADPAATTGTITAQLKTSEPIVKAWAILRDKTPDGLYAKPIDATVADGKFTATNLPVPGRYDLRFQTASGTVEGWDANLPR